MMKRALGRGLGALLPSTDPEEPSRVRDLPIESLVPNPQQPRKTFAPEALAELAASIRASGILEPIIVRPRGDRYEIVVGERRWRAAQQAGLTRIPTQIRELSDAETLELALEENLLREDLNPSKLPRRISGFSANLAGRRKSWLNDSGRTARRSRMRCDSCGFPSRFRPISGPGASVWATLERSLALPPRRPSSSCASVSSPKSGPSGPPKQGSRPLDGSPHRCAAADFRHQAGAAGRSRSDSSPLPRQGSIASLPERDRSAQRSRGAESIDSELAA